jgi:hypothetical protein
LNVDVVVGASTESAAFGGGKARKPVRSRRTPIPRTMSTRKTPLVIASLQEMGINISGPVENPDNLSIPARDVGQVPEVVTVLPERSQLTLPGLPGSQPSVSALTNTYPNLVPPRDELLASGESDSNGYGTPGEDLQRHALLPGPTSIRTALMW